MSRTALAAGLALLAGCESIGEGSTIKTLTIEAANSAHEATPFELQRCLRDQLVVVGTFTDGTRADFSFRANWTSSDPSVVQVSNNDIPTTAVISGAFTTIPTLPYRPGTLIPQAATGTVTITASYIGLTATRTVTIAAPTFRIVPVTPGANPNGVQPTQFLGPDTTIAYGFLSQRSNGEIETPDSLNALGALNPILWRLQGGELDLRDSTIAGDFDKYAAPSAADPSIIVATASGFVTGIKADPATYTVEAVTSLCENEPAFTATAPARVADFATPPLTLTYPPNFNGPGVANGEMVAGTSQGLVVTGNLDTDGTLSTAEQFIDLSNQVDLRVTHTTTCTAGETNCTCDTGNVNCQKRLIGSTNSLVFTLVTDDGASANVQACRTDIDDVHGDDCEEDDLGEDTALESNVLPVVSIPVDLSGATGSFTVSPSGASEPARTYPGQRFTAYGNFTALNGTPFAGGTSATGTQDFTNSVTWVTRPAGSTTTGTDVAAVRNSHDGFFNPIGSVAYFKDVATNTVLDISILPRPTFAEIDPPAPVPFTVCPSSGCVP